MSFAPFLAEAAANGLAERVAASGLEFDRALDLDPLSHAKRTALNRCALSWSEAFLGEGETVRCSGSGYGLATSVLGLQVVNDLPGVLVQLRRLLAPDGMLAMALVGGESLRELRAAIAAAETEHWGGASPRVAPLVDVRDLGNLMQRAGFKKVVTDAERTTAQYSSFEALVRDLRANALTNTLASRNRRPLSRAVRDSTVAHYRQSHAAKAGGLCATFDIIYGVGYAP